MSIEPVEPTTAVTDNRAEHVSALSHRGTEREENQDSFAAHDDVWIVADGLGGHRGGRTASAVAVSLVGLLTPADNVRLTEVLEFGHDMVCDVGERLGMRDMGTTIVVAVRSPETDVVQLAWCGDSRAYHLTDEGLHRLTTDHNVAEELLAAGQITREEAHHHPGQFRVTSILGGGGAELPKIGLHEFPAKGRLLLCTDGLTSGLRDEEIKPLLATGSPKEAADLLVAAAVNSGSTDDTTVIVVDLEQEVARDREVWDEVTTGATGQVVEAVEALGGRVSGGEPGIVDFYLDNVWGLAYDKGGEILRCSFFLSGDVPYDEALEWVEAQPRPRASVLQPLRVADGSPEARVRLVFERLMPLAADDIGVIVKEVQVYAEARERCATVSEEDLPDLAYAPPSVLASPPRNAWLLYGSRASLQSPDDLAYAREDALGGLHYSNWTVPKHVEPGDLVFVYFTSPIKEIRYVARVASHPFVDDDLVANVDKPIANQQWWAYLTPMHEIDAMPLAELQRIAGEKVVGRAHGGTYLRPEMADNLSAVVRPADPSDERSLQSICQPVTAREDLPDPDSMTFEEWRSLPVARLRFEKEVERHVVEPFLRWALAEHSGAEVRRQDQLNKLIPDYAVYVHDQVALVVEAKQRILRARGQDWSQMPEALQVQRYMQQRGCNGVLIDAHRVYLFELGQQAPVHEFDRVTATEVDLGVVAALIKP